MTVYGTNGAKLFAAAVFGTAMMMTAASASAATVVVPSTNTSVEGNTNNNFPYNITPFPLTGQRYQQVYAASQFGTAGYITQIRYRPDASAGPFSTVLPNIQIGLSVTPIAPGALSPTYASNIGGPQTIVHSGPLALSSAFTGPGIGPKDFDIVINLQTPFFYDPAKGNLLLEVKNFGAGTSAVFDAESGGVTSRVYNTDNNPNGTTGLADNIGLVTQFILVSNAVQLSYAANLSAGQSVIDITNAGTTEGGGPLPDYLCVNVYAFAQDQQLISCCTCSLSPNDLQTLSVQNDLINNTLTPGVPAGVTVALVATDDGPGHTPTDCNAATVTTAGLADGMRAWGTTVHAAPGGGFGVTEKEFSKIGLSSAELSKMTSYCGFIQANGSHYGICNSCTQGAAGAKKQ